MSTILLVEDAPDLGLFEAGLLEAAGHRVLRCGGGPSPLAPCPMLRRGRCALAEAADLIVFSCALFPPVRGRTYRGIDVLRGYRSHTDYGRRPMLIVSVGAPRDLSGGGPVEVVEKHANPPVVIDAARRLLDARRPNGRTIVPQTGGREALGAASAS